MLRLSPYIYVAPAVFNHGSVEYITFFVDRYKKCPYNPQVKNDATAPLSSRKVSTFIV